MRFLLSKESRLDPLVKRLITATLCLSALFFILNTWYHGITLGFTPQELDVTFLGDADEFIDPIPFTGVLLQAHIDLVAALMLVMFLGPVLIRIYQGARYSRFAMHLLGATGLIAPALLLAAYALNGVWTMFYWGALILWNSYGFVLSLTLLIKVVRYAVKR